ncbi:EF-hand calcium-binding domain-containing protein 6-like [Tubulanus polymorphus]|uniref:EF-hand calcium-binding domain-containing protein 6-like n=1 Tax=Tubulanus polymorphus TaxID=672921 RepID=UPI003DA2228F
MAQVMPGLRPQSFSVRPSTTTRLPPTTPVAVSVGHSRSESFTQNEKVISRSSTFSERSSNMSAGRNMPDNSLSVIDVENMLQQKVAAKYRDLQQAFQNYDIDKNLSVTRGEFRRVLELYCFPMTTEQFSAIVAKVETNSNGTIRYCDFLDKFNTGRRPPSKADSWTSGTHRYVAQQSAKESLNVDVIETLLKEKISRNVKNLVKALRLFDYNRDGQVQQHELRKVLENYCFKFSDAQFNKLWQRYDFHHTGLINYREFLRRIGINVDGNGNRPVSEGTRAALTWDHNEQKENGLRVVKPVIKRNDDNDMKLNFDKIEAEFRKRMKANHNNLRKAFLAFDRSHSGFVSITDLKSILSNFTIPMSDQLFLALMERCGVKASGRISWEIFLNKFQDPQAFGNGQTLPIRHNNHQYFPVRGTGQAKSDEEVIDLLHDKVLHHYPSLKHAFLQFDKNRDGKISRKELREILNSFKFPITDDQYRDLLIELDPQHTNFINYHSFLEIFEPKESEAAHKWLNSVHRFNDKQKPVVMAWDTVEEILQEKISYRWKEFSEDLVAADQNEENAIFPWQLKDIIDSNCLPLTDEHFEHLLKRCDEREDGKVNYLDFLIKLGIDVQPTDKTGLSTQIYDGSEAAERRRLDDLVARQGLSNDSVQQRTEGMCEDEVIAKLKDRMAQHKTSIRQSFMMYDKHFRGRISKNDFRKVCEMYGFTFTNEQFKSLSEKLGFVNGFLTYSDFITSFEDPRPNGPGEFKLRSDNHHVNPIRGDEWGMTAEEALLKLQNKLRENFSDLRGAFYKFDDNHNGYLTKVNFRRLCDAFMFVMTDREFSRLCERLGIGKKAKISYQDFLDKFEVRDRPEGHHWISDHRYNDAIPTKSMTAEEVHEVLAEKAHLQWTDLAKAFRSMDKDGNAVITKRELKEVLYKFILPIDSTEYNKLWNMLDTKGCGFISHQIFLEKLGTNFAPGDQQGHSKRIVQDSYETIVRHNEEQLEKHKLISYNTAQRNNFLSVEEVHRLLKARIQDQYADTYTTFRKYDTKKKGFLSIDEIQKVLCDLNFYLSDKQFFELLDRIGLYERKSKLNYEQFLKAFEEGRHSSYGQRPSASLEIPYNPKLSPFDAECELREKVSNDYETLEKAFSTFDRSGKQKIKASDFRSVLDNFAYRLTDPQFKQLVSKLKVSGDNLVDYATFLDSFCKAADTEADNWMDSLQKTVRARTPHPLPIDEVMQLIKESVQARVYHIAKAFNDSDYANIGVVCKEDFKGIMDEHIMRLTDEQFDRVWNNLPVNEFGNLEYKDFLILLTGKDGTMQRVMKREKQTNTPAPQRPSSAVFARKSASSGKIDVRLRNSIAAPPTGLARSYTFAGTPLINAETIEMRLKDIVCKHWQEIQRKCRAKDKNDIGELDIMDFRDVLCQYASVSDEDFAKLVVKYDVKNNGRFPYMDFLRHFVLTLKHRQPHITERKKLPDTRSPVNTGVKTTYFYDAMLRCQNCVSDNWKKMRRSFRAVDKSGSGFVYPNDFRSILKSYNMNLSEEEFYHLMSYYDKDLSGQVSYNDFIKAFLTNP